MRQSIQLSFSLALATAVAACSGALILPQQAGQGSCTTALDCGFERACDLATGRCIPSVIPCSLATQEGYCGEGLACVCGGYCLADESACSTTGGSLCDCPIAQGCADGVCTDITPVNECTPQRHQGLCDNGETCVGGHCVPVPDPNRCSVAVPNGWCGSSRTCVRGTCVLTSSRPCSKDQPDGHCGDGRTCDAGTCVDRPCETDSPGVCLVDQVCIDGNCVDLDCSPDHPSGACSIAGERCSVLGRCIGAQDCLAAEDCDPPPDSLANTYCSLSSQTCMFFGSCAVDADCSLEEQATSFGTGYRCDAGSCVERLTNCDAVTAPCRPGTPGRYCSSGQNCLIPGQCDDTSDCGSGETCSFETDVAGLRVCTTEICLDDQDCPGSNGCAGLVTSTIPNQCVAAGCRCLTPGKCLQPADCPVGFSCAAGTCVRSGLRCSVNTFTNAGATCGDLFCCTNMICDNDFSSCADSSTCGGGTCQSACCPVGQKCSTTDIPGVTPTGDPIGSCIAHDACIDDSDCFGPNFVCDPTTATCVPAAAQACDPLACPGPSAPGTCCNLGEYCSLAGACVPVDRCGVDNRDCPIGEVCNAVWECEPHEECDFQRLSAGALVPPNMLIVLDRSGSMNACAGTVSSTASCCGTNGDDTACTCAQVCDPINCTGCEPLTSCDPVLCDYNDPGICNAACATPRWEEAATAISDLITTQEGRIAFGLATYPEQCSPVNNTAFTDVDCARTTPDCSSLDASLVCSFPDCTSDANCTAPASTCDTAIGKCRDGKCALDPSAPCAYPCNACSCQSFCDNNGNGTPDSFEGLSPGPGNHKTGIVNVDVAVTSRIAIVNKLDITPPFLPGTIFPGGGTPTGQTLRKIAADPSSVGLGQADRENVLLLVTDGEASGDNASVRVCEPPCNDGGLDGDETDIDCGGSCDGCDVLKACLVNADCLSNACRGNICRDATCANGSLDGGEVDVDCGPTCGACADGNICANPTDCQSGFCSTGTCDTPTCADTRQNGGETDQDCGGECLPCADGLGCRLDSDCLNGVCQAGICRRTECGDTVLDSGIGETAVDVAGTNESCGGPCEPCADNLACVDVAFGTDCKSGQCVASTCWRDPCDNGILDGTTETDVDCGGSCPPCGGGKYCQGAGDCLSGTCGDCTDIPCRVNASLDVLFGRLPRIKTYVVGFAFATVSDNLNCHATYGRTARSDNCPDVSRNEMRCDNDTKIVCTDDTPCTGGGGTCSIPECAVQASACYYEASDRATLAAAFDDIITQVASCSFDLLATPPSALRMFAYLDQSNVLTRLNRDISHAEGWDYDAATNRVGFYGTACDDILAQTAAPIIIMGADGEGGCN